jgi:hypothetical protein
MRDMRYYYNAHADQIFTPRVRNVVEPTFWGEDEQAVLGPVLAGEAERKRRLEVEKGGNEGDAGWEVGEVDEEGDIVRGENNRSGYAGDMGDAEKEENTHSEDVNSYEGN